MPEHDSFADYLRLRLHDKLRIARVLNGSVERPFHMGEARRLARLLRQYGESLR